MANIGHPQPKTLVHCDNATAVGIANNMVKRQRSQSMEMRFMWVGDKVSQEMFDLTWHPGIENLADYQSKHHVGSHHVKVRPYYIHMDNSPRVLPRALRPSTLKGCVGTLEGGYVRNVPLPRVPRIQTQVDVRMRANTHSDPSRCIQVPIPRVPRVQSASHMTGTCYSHVPRVPTWSDLTRLLAGLGRCILPFSPVWLV